LADDSLVGAFNNADLSGIPSLWMIADPRQQIMWVLHVGKLRAGIEFMKPSEIAHVLRDVQGVSVSRQRVEAILSKEKDAVARRRKGGKRAYQLMAAGAAEIEAMSSSVLVIEPDKALSSLRATEALLGSVAGTTKICDPYVDSRTLDLVAECAGATTIQLLTMNVNKRTKFERDVKAFAKQHAIALEVRVISRRVLHDRYVIHDAGMLLFGTSLNGLGFKQSFVIALGEDIRASVEATFDAYWASATPL
jgi:hypothetical protein